MENTTDRARLDAAWKIHAAMLRPHVQIGRAWTQDRVEVRELDTGRFSFRNPPRTVRLETPWFWAWELTAGRMRVKRIVEDNLGLVYREERRLLRRQIVILCPHTRRNMVEALLHVTLVED